MLMSYIRIALRNFARNKTHTVITLLGLTLAFAGCTVIMVFFRSEYDVNACFRNGDRIFRVNSIWREPSMGLFNTTIAPVGPILAREYPEVESQARLYLVTATVHVGATNLHQEAIITDPTFMSLFDFPLLSGDPQTALSSPRSAVVSDRLAEKLFGTTDVLGKVIRLDTWRGSQADYVVTAVRKTLPFNSVTNFGEQNYDLFLPFNRQGDFLLYTAWESWESRYLITYVRLRSAEAVEKLRADMATLLPRFAPGSLSRDVRIDLEPLRNLYLDDNNGLARKRTSLLMILAAVILVIAVTNGINLTTAQSLARAREAAVRRVVGGQRRHVIMQYVTESVLACLCAMGVAISLTELMVDGQLLGVGQVTSVAHRWDMLAIFSTGVLSVVAGVVMGVAPGMLVSSFTPVSALKGQFRTSRWAKILRRTLVAGQFTAAIVLIISVLTISRQLSFISKKDLGFEHRNLMVIESVPREWNRPGVSRMETVKNRLLEIPGVDSATLSFETPTHDAANSVSLRPPGGDPATAVNLALYVVDEQYAATYGLTMKEGRFFSAERAADSTGVVINETAARALGLQSPVGTTLVNRQGGQATIIGVVKDFHFESLHRTIRPLCFVPVRQARAYRYLSLRLSDAGLEQTIGRIHTVWKELLPEAPFETSFVDRKIDQEYRPEQKLKTIVEAFAVLAFSIACMGMFGLVSIATVRRVKEIGVRRTLGASMISVVGLVTREVLVLVTLANILAWPLAYLTMDLWLQDFAYRVPINPWIFPAIGAGAVLLGFLTVAGRAARAAAMNPAEALKYE